MKSIGFYCDAKSIEQNAMAQLQQYAQKPFVNAICAFTDIHYCAEKALPVGVAFQTTDYCYPLITGLQLTREFSQVYGKDVDFVHRDFLTDEFRQYYNATLTFGYERRKNFCIKTLLFLQKANYVRCDKNAIDKDYLSFNYKNLEEEGSLNGTSYIMEDSIHNHVRFMEQHIMHRKGSTEQRENSGDPFVNVKGKFIGTSWLSFSS